MDHQLRLMRSASRILTLTAVEMAGLAELGIPQSQLDVIGGGLDPLPPLPDTDELLTRFGVQRPFVICVGRASYEKGTIHAAQAVLALRRQGSPVSLVQVGQTSPEFDRFLSRLDDGEREGIRPLGILNDSEKHGLLSQTSALLLPSRTDSFGIVLLEAWAHGKPVIGARAGGIPGVIDDEQNGLLVTFGDVPGLAEAIARLLTNPTLNQQIGQQGQQKAQTTYTWDKVADRVLKNYRAALSVQQREPVPS
jgi:glycosyltransferase involved in cell wall biosynthesis